MATILGFVHLTWLTVFCSILSITFAQENGMDGKKAEGFSCMVNSYTFKGPTTKCTWKAGKMAPQDTQYFLYFQHYIGRFTIGEEEKECPQYLNNKHGRHVGCYFPNITVNQYSVQFRLTGSSKDSVIQPSTYKLLLYEHERLDPPHNITVNCPEQSTFCTVTWRPPPSSRNVPEHCYKYQIKDVVRNTVSTVSDVTSKDILRDAKYNLKFRTAGQFCAITSKFGGWSEPFVFDAPPTKV